MLRELDPQRDLRFDTPARVRRKEDYDRFVGRLWRFNRQRRRVGAPLLAVLPRDRGGDGNRCLLPV